MEFCIQVYQTEKLNLVCNKSLCFPSKLESWSPKTLLFHSWVIISTPWRSQQCLQEALLVEKRVCGGWHCGVRGYSAMKSFHHYTVKGCGISPVTFMSEEWGTEEDEFNAQPTWDTGIWLKCTKLLKMYAHHSMATAICLCIEYIYSPLPMTFIKSFPHVTKMTVKLIIHLIMVMPPYYPCPVFSLSHYSYKNT